MTLSIDVVDIKNNMHQLNALPIEESVFIILTAKPDPEQIKKRVSLFRIDSESTWPSVGDPNSTQILYSKEKFGNVDYDFKIVQDGALFSLQIDPIEKLYTNSRYVLFVEKGLAPQYYTISKTLSRGNSSIRIDTKGESTLVEEAIYELVITSTSILGQGTHVVTYNLFKNLVQIATNATIDILSDNAEIILNTNTSIAFNSKYPFIATERFSIVLNSASRLLSNKNQDIQTYIDSDVIKTEDNPSGRIEYSDILEFYKDNVFIQNQEPSRPTGEISAKVAYKSLDTFIVTFNKDISLHTFNASSFDFSFSEAFDNYLLSNIAKYSELNKYIITFHRKDAYTLVFKIAPDTNNTITTIDKYVVVEV